MIKKKEDTNPRHVFPWRNIRFVKSKQGGTVHADVWLSDLKGKYTWHSISFSMDLEGFKKLSALSEDRRCQMLESLATVPIRAGIFDEKKRPRGRNKEAILNAWVTARWLGPLLLKWIKEGGSKTPIYKTIKSQMGREGFVDQSSTGVAGYLVERNWCNAYKKWPEGFSCPTEDPEHFFVILKRNNPHPKSTRLSRKPIEDLVSDILQGRDPIILLPDDKSSIPMTWF